MINPAQAQKRPTFQYRRLAEKCSISADERLNRISDNVAGIAAYERSGVT
jgi:hypothetical protein